MRTKQEIEKLHGELTQFLTDIRRIQERLDQDDDAENLFTGLRDFTRLSPGLLVKRAEKRLANRTYRIALAGMFSGGKSTVINALLKEPDFLPVAAGECTLSITTIRRPSPGEDEHIQVQYFSREEAVRNLLLNPGYAGVFADHMPENEQFGAEEGLKAMRDAVAATTKAGQKELLNRVDHIRDFMEALDTYTDRLGREDHVDRLENASAYLTTDADDRGMGHLLLIQQVFLFRNNPLFVEGGIEIVDLPGTDSVNPRQKEITLRYLEESDVVLNVVQPRGFSEADKEIQSEMARHHPDIRNKMFFVINMIDTLDASTLSNASALTKLMQEQVKGSIVGAGLRADRLFATSARTAELQDRAARRPDDAGVRSELDIMKKKLSEALSRLPQDIPDDLHEMLEVAFKDGGMEYLRDYLTRYLEGEIRFERLRDVFADLGTLVGGLEKLFGPVKSEIGDMPAELLERQQTTRFSEQLRGSIFDMIDDLSSRVPGAVGNFVERARKDILAALELLVARDNDGLSLQRVRQGIRVVTPRAIKERAIALCRERCADLLVAKVEEAVAGPVLERFEGEFGKTKIGEAFDKLEKQIGGNVALKFHTTVDTLRRDLRRAVRFRALEEAEKILRRDLKVVDVEMQWNVEVEKKFRQDLKRIFSEELGGALDNLRAGVESNLVHTLREGREAVDTVCGEVIDRIRHGGVSLPWDALPGGGEAQDRKARICEYLAGLERVSKAFDPLQEVFAAAS